MQDEVKKTPREIAIEILEKAYDDCKNKPEMFMGFKRTALPLFEAALERERQAAQPMVVSDSQIEFFAKEKFSGDSPTSFTGRAIWKDGFRKAMEVRARAEMAKLWPSDDAITSEIDRGCKRRGLAGMYDVNYRWGGLDARKWLKARVLGAE